MTTDTHVIAITYANLDYLGLADVWFREHASGREHHHPIAIPGAWGFAQSERVDDARIFIDRLGLRLELRDEPEGTWLRFRSRRLGGGRLEGELFVERPAGHETLSVVVPWSDRRFQLTSKHQCRPTRGELTLDGTRYAFGPDNHAFGCLDFGRGVWPFATTWNWASASGLQGGRVVGLNLGGQWTDGTASTENALVIDGRLHKISEDLRFEYDRRDFSAPWRLSTPSGAIELRFVPFHERASRIELGLLRSEVHQCFGHFEGSLRPADGPVVEVTELLGWAEEHRARW